MNTNYILTVFVATAFIAGALAVAPVDEASAVHTTIQNSQMKEAGTISAEQFNTDLITSDHTITSTADFVVSCLVSAQDGTDTITITDATATSGAMDILDADSFAFIRAVDANDTLTLSSAAQDDDSYCSAMTLVSGAITYDNGV